MARYIEREKFLKKCTEAFERFGLIVRVIEEISDECTTADVAPKSEVAKEIFEEIEKFCRPPMPECQPLCIIRKYELAELKKKYTAESKPIDKVEFSE